VTPPFVTRGYLSTGLFGKKVISLLGGNWVPRKIFKRRRDFYWEGEGGPTPKRGLKKIEAPFPYSRIRSPNLWWGNGPQKR